MVRMFLSEYEEKARSLSYNSGIPKQIRVLVGYKSFIKGQIFPKKVLIGTQTLESLNTKPFP